MSKYAGVVWLVSMLAFVFLLSIEANLTLAGTEQDPETTLVEEVPAAEPSEDDGGDPVWPKVRYWLGTFHPAFAHFPIALLLAAVPAELLGRWLTSDGLISAGRYCVVLGALGAVITATLGFFWIGFGLTEGGWNMLTQHRLAGTATAALGVWLLISCCFAARPGAKAARRVYLVSLLATAALVGLTGFLGGALVWGTDHLWPF